MSTLETGPAGLDGRNTQRKAEWAYHPPLPVENAPLFQWPPNPLKIVKWFATTWLAPTERVLILLIAIATWFYLQPALENCVEFAPGWIAHIYVRNMGLMLVVAGGLHLYLYTFRKQGEKRRFDLRSLVKNSRSFTWRNQVRDNMFWSCASGVTVWTAYEVLMMWAYANGYVPMTSWGDNPVWFVLLLVLVPVWYSFHFYWFHRLLHWQPLYRAAHALHHRNVNIGPWSGLSMHPIEHVLYFSSALIHFVVASHPIHILYNVQYFALAAVTAHSGYETLLVKDKDSVNLGYFFHQLHHRYFECNYGTGEMPWDKWFGSFHDGTPEATQKMRQRRKRLRGAE